MCWRKYTRCLWLDLLGEVSIMTGVPVVVSLQGQEPGSGWNRYKGDSLLRLLDTEGISTHAAGSESPSLCRQIRARSARASELSIAVWMLRQGLALQVQARPTLPAPQVQAWVANAVACPCCGVHTALFSALAEVACVCLPRLSQLQRDRESLWFFSSQLAPPSVSE